MPIVPQQGPGVAIPQTNQVVVSTSIDVLAGSSALPIGFAQSINPNFTRRADRIRHLDSGDAGRTVEQAVGPEDYSLRVSGFACYSDNSQPGGAQKIGSLLDRLLGAAGPQTVGSVSNAVFTCLSSQILPFDVIEATKRPGFGSVLGRSVYKKNVMTAFSKPINISTITIAEEVTMQPTFIG